MQNSVKYHEFTFVIARWHEHEFHTKYSQTSRVIMPKYRTISCINDDIYHDGLLKHI